MDDDEELEKAMQSISPTKEVIECFEYFLCLICADLAFKFDFGPVLLNARLLHYQMFLCFKLQLLLHHHCYVLYQE